MEVYHRFLSSKLSQSGRELVVLDMNAQVIQAIYDFKKTIKKTTARPASLFFRAMVAPFATKHKILSETTRWARETSVCAVFEVQLKFVEQGAVEHCGQLAIPGARGVCEVTAQQTR